MCRSWANICCDDFARLLVSDNELSKWHRKVESFVLRDNNCRRGSLNSQVYRSTVAMSCSASYLLNRGGAGGSSAKKTRRGARGGPAPSPRLPGPPLHGQRNRSRRWRLSSWNCRFHHQKNFVKTFPAPQANFTLLTSIHFNWGGRCHLALPSPGGRWRRAAAAGLRPRGPISISRAMLLCD